MSLNNSPNYKYYPLNHSLNEMMIERFIDASDILVREIMKKIISNIHHISFKDLIKNLKMN